MNEHSLPSANDERYGALALIRRLLTEQGLVHWRKYVVAFVLMAISAGCTAFSAYLIGDVINQTYVHRNLTAVFVLGGITVALFTIKGLATYGHSVMLSRIGNRIVADNQRAVFAKLLHEGLTFFSDRHSTEFIARLSTGAAACTQVINLLITSLGRDLLSLIGLVTVMVVQDPMMSFFSFVVAPPAFLMLRKLIRRVYKIARTQFDGGTRILETLQETLQGIRIVKAFTLEDDHARALRPQRRGGRARGQQDGARLQPRQPADGNARRLRDRHRHHLWRLSRDRYRRDARRILLVHHRLPAGLRAGQAAGPAQHRAQQRAGGRARPVRGDRQSAERAARPQQAGLADRDAAAGIRRRAFRATAATRRCCPACRWWPSPAS